MEQQSKYHVSETMIESERDLILAAIEHPEKFEVLYDKYYKQILLFVYQRVDSKDDAYDITAQVFLKAFENLKKYVHRDVPFSAWLYRVAINEMNTLFRKNKVMRAINIDTVNLDEMAHEMDTSGKEELIKSIVESLKALNEYDLLLVEMRFFEKRSFKEIGEILDITENNAKVKLYRALDKIKVILNQHIKMEAL